MAGRGSFRREAIFSLNNGKSKGKGSKPLAFLYEEIVDLQAADIDFVAVDQYAFSVVDANNVGMMLFFIMRASFFKAIKSPEEFAVMR